MISHRWLSIAKNRTPSKPNPSQTAIAHYYFSYDIKEEIAFGNFQMLGLELSSKMMSFFLGCIFRSVDAT